LSAPTCRSIKQAWLTRARRWVKRRAWRPAHRAAGGWHRAACSSAPARAELAWPLLQVVQHQLGVAGLREVARGTSRHITFPEPSQIELTGASRNRRPWGRSSHSRCRLTTSSGFSSQSHARLRFQNWPPTSSRGAMRCPSRWPTRSGWPGPLLLDGANAPLSLGAKRPRKRRLLAAALSAVSRIYDPQEQRPFQALRLSRSRSRYAPTSGLCAAPALARLKTSQIAVARPRGACAWQFACGSCS